MDDRVLERLEGAQQRFLALAKRAPYCEALAASVPHMVGLIEDRVPTTNAVILRQGDVREMLTRLVLDVLEAQASHVEHRVRQARPL
jgi:hypothetical protein